MAEPILQHYRILVIEDEYMLAEDLQLELGDAGAVVLGPVGTLEQAIALINQEHDIDGAVLDVNLRGEKAFPAADLLHDRGIPFVFTTGYDASAMPSRFEHIVRCEKPISMANVTRALSRIVGSPS